MNSTVFKILYYLLSFTWGLLSNIPGALIALTMIVSGHRPKRFCGSIYFECRGHFGGFSYGIFFVKDESQSEHLLCHEYGHSIQNCFFGPFMLFAVNIPSTFRYWYRRFKTYRKRSLKTGYDDIWFEGQASALGTWAYHKYYQ